MQFMKSNLINSNLLKSFIFSLIIGLGFFFQYGYVNNDAFYYLDGAFNIEHNLSSAIPNYSYLIFYISKFLNINYYQSGLLINFISLNLIYIFLIKINEIISNKKSVVDDYLILIFLITGSFFSYYFMIIRDNAYAALFLLSILFFFYHVNNNKNIYRVFSILSIFFASLLRFEALAFIFIFLLPQNFFNFNTWKLFLNFTFRIKMLLILFFIILILSIHISLDFFYISKKINNYFNYSFSSNISFRDNLINENLGYIIFLLSLTLPFFKLIKSIGFVQSYFIFSNLRDNYKNIYFRVIIFVVCLNLLICFYWALVTNVITSRYLYISSLLLLVVILDPLKSFFSNRKLIYVLMLVIYFLFFIFKNFTHSFNKLSLSRYISSFNLISYEILDRNINFYRFFSLDSYFIDQSCSDNLPSSNYIIIKKSDYKRCNHEKINLYFDYELINDDALEKKYILLKKKL